MRGDLTRQVKKCGLQKLVGNWYRGLSLADLSASTFLKVTCSDFWLLKVEVPLFCSVERWNTSREGGRYPAFAVVLKQRSFVVGCRRFGKSTTSSEVKNISVNLIKQLAAYLAHTCRKNKGR